MSAVGRRAEPSGKRYRVGRLGSSDGSVRGEIDAANRIVSAAVTDMNGHFTLKVQKP